MSNDQPKQSKNKSIDKAEYAAVGTILRQLRINARPKLSQAELAEAMHRPQTFVSDVELGIRRLDALQLREWALACGATFTEFARQLDMAMELIPKLSDRSKVAKRARVRKTPPA